MSTNRRHCALTREVLDTLPLNVAVLDGDGIVIGTNRAWREFGADNGLTRAPDAVGVSYLEITDAAAADGNEDARRVAEGLREVLSGSREPFTMEYPCHSPTERRWFLLRAAPVVGDGDGHVVVAHADVTDRVLAERRVERQRDELADDRERLSLLNQLLRHDVRNDLAVVTGWGELLAEHVEPEGEEALRRMVGATNHTLELVEAADDFAEFVDGADTLAAVDLSAVLTAEVDKLRAAYEGRSTSVTVTGTDALRSGVAVLATPLLSSVFSNLLNNAVLHNDEPKVRVEVVFEEREGTVVVRVADNGPGVPDDRKRPLFGRGEKGPESPGSGFGLYLVECYGGSVWIEDAEPRGAVFCVELRRAR